MGRIGLIKIDTEGYDYHVIAGCRDYLESTKPRPPIVCEVSPRPMSLLGVSLGELDQLLRDLGYVAVSLVDLKSDVRLTELTEQTDVLFRARGG